jgi:hypothetical protein
MQMAKGIKSRYRNGLLYDNYHYSHYSDEENILNQKPQQFLQLSYSNNIFLKVY